MGKYMRKCRGPAGEEVAAVEVTQVVGVRTRSRAAGATAGGVTKVVPKRKKAPPPAAATDSVGAGGVDGGSCYLHLRSRMLFKAPAPPRAPAPAEGQVAATVLSRCSSTASSSAAAAQERSGARRPEEEQAGGGAHIPEDSGASNSGCGRDRERREATPSSPARGESSDLESDLAGRESGRPAAAAVQPLVPPPAAEIEEFFAAAEEAEVRRFTSKYNFDVVRGVPLAGRFEWTPVAASSIDLRRPSVH